MLGLQKSKRVSWATGENLCQVKLFLSEDTPSQVGVGTEDHLQPKKRTPFLYNSVSLPVADDGLPPGFEEVNPETQLLKNKLALIPLAKWKCPPKILVDDSWRVTAGEESTEVETQNQRESRVLEAIYPRLSDIPPNPALSVDAANAFCDDSRAVLVPITAVDEEDPPEEVQQPGQETLIDPELLVKFLSNPALLEEFLKRQEHPLPPPPPPPPHFTQNLPSPTVNPKDQFYPQPIHQHPPPIIPTAAQSTSTQPPKDMNYLKTLIQQHGYGRLQEAAPPPPFMAQHNSHVHGPAPNPNPNPNPMDNNNQGRPTREPKSKFMKPCIFFNSPKGCRHGASCTYQHDSSLQQRSSSAPEMQGNKRAKMNREMRGAQSYN